MNEWFRISLLYPTSNGGCVCVCFSNPKNQAHLKCWGEQHNSLVSHISTIFQLCIAFSDMWEDSHYKIQNQKFEEWKTTRPSSRMNWKWWEIRAKERSGKETKRFLSFTWKLQVVVGASMWDLILNARASSICFSYLSHSPSRRRRRGRTTSAMLMLRRYFNSTILHFTLSARKKRADLLLPRQRQSLPLLFLHFFRPLKPSLMASSDETLILRRLDKVRIEDVRVSEMDGRSEGERESVRQRRDESETP